MSKTTPAVAPQSSTATRTIVTILLLVFLLPVGVIVMWAWSKWVLWLKGVITFLSIPAMLFLFGVISAMLIAVKNPSETMALARDTARITEVATLKDMIGRVQTGNFCGAGTAPCLEDSYPIKDSTTKADGTGWIKINLSTMTAKLPIDPVNNEEYNYTYCSDGKDWEISIALESTKLADKAKTDGGVSPELYEVGSKLDLCD